MHVMFPAIKGFQGGYVFYSIQAPFAALATSFVFDDRDLPIELRSQRELNLRRAEAFAEYLAKGDGFVTGTVTGTVDERAEFIPFEGSFSTGNIGMLKLPVDYRIVLCDGQHRQRGIEIAVTDAKVDANSDLPITLYEATAVERKQQIFTDINSNTVKPSSSLTMAFDHRSNFTSFVKECAKSIPSISNGIDWEKSSVGSKSLRLWPLVSFKSFICNLTGLSEKSFDERITDENAKKALLGIVIPFLKGLDHLPMWKDMLARKIPVNELRQDYIVGHAVFLEALGFYGAHLLQKFNEEEKVDWSQMELLANVPVDKLFWSGRCVSPQGTITKTAFGIKSTASKICHIVGVPTSDVLDDAESKVV